jgi:hypothetical protein
MCLGAFSMLGAANSWLPRMLLTCHCFLGGGGVFAQSYELEGWLALANAEFMLGQKPPDRYFWVGADGERWLARIWHSNAAPPCSWCLAGEGRAFCAELRGILKGAQGWFCGP